MWIELDFLIIHISMEEHETPIDIYTHDLLGMKKSSWHRTEQPKEEFPEPIPLSPKQKYITILLCVGFLYFVALGVWTILPKRFSMKMAEVNTQVFIPSQVIPTESIRLRFVESHTFLPIYSSYHYKTYWSWRPAFSEIDKDLAWRMDRREAIWNSITPPPNWENLRNDHDDYMYINVGCLNGF